jgi:hypothetical protein
VSRSAVLAALASLLADSAARAQVPPPPAPYPPAAPYAPAPPPAAPYAPTPVPYSPYAAPSYRLAPPMHGPVVEMTTDNDYARLQIMQFKWRDVCRAPCGVPVDPNGIYRIGGGTVRPSESFSMPRASGTVQLDTQVGSTVRHWVGVGLSIGGGVAAAFGGAMYAIGSDIQPDPYSGNAGRDFFHTFGLIYLGAGVLLAAIGIPLAMSSTTVQVR